MNDTPKEYCTVKGVDAIKALAHEDRLAILEQLRDGPRTASEVARALGIAAQKIGYHIKKLEEAGLVRFCNTGRKRWKEERYFVAEARHYLVDPALACDDPATQTRLAAEVELRFQQNRLEQTLEQGLPGVARKVVADVLELEAGQVLLLMGGPFTLELADAIIVAAEAVGAIVLQRSWDRAYILGRLDAHSADELATQELFPSALLSQVDAVCQLTSAITQGAPPSPEQRAKLPHLLRAVTEFQRKLRDAGVPHLEVSVPSSRDFEGFASAEIGMDTYWRALDQDRAALAPHLDAVAAAFAGAQSMRLRDREGGELLVQLRPTTRAERSLTPSLPSGAHVQLVEPGTAQGTLVADYTMAGGKHYAGVRATLRDGKLTELAGAEAVAELEERIDSESGDVRSLAYFALGLSPVGDALTGKTSLDSILAGVVTLAFGTSTEQGGEQSATLDLRFPLTGATLELDGRVLVRDGALEL
ncbi:MAG: helix-turn-helix domain-containing protein [Planctomycetes bacterium]|nr:helix-turn-helix domain-containing protein [Planctomycetota bacterium]MCB9904497.1 helix-turn-helix domain-containing protein [Planctomycetota bacterium]